MKNAIDIVKEYNEACEKKIFNKVEQLLHPQFTFRDPLVGTKKTKDFLNMMKECTFDCKVDNMRFVKEGDTVVQAFDLVFVDRSKATIRMCEFLTIKDNQIFSSEVFYDSAKFPQEVLEKIPASV